MLLVCPDHEEKPDPEVRMDIPARPAILVPREIAVIRDTRDPRETMVFQVYPDP